MLDETLLRSVQVYGRVIRQAWITEADMAAHPDSRYLFGDNMAGSGLGGQAKVMRGKPNAIGIPTKWAPSMREGSFFRDADIEHGSPVKRAIDRAFGEAVTALSQGRTIVIPEAGLGTDRAELPLRAPAVYRYILAWMKALDLLAGPTQAGETTMATETSK